MDYRNQSGAAQAVPENPRIMHDIGNDIAGAGAFAYELAERAEKLCTRLFGGPPVQSDKGNASSVQPVPSGAVNVVRDNIGNLRSALDRINAHIARLEDLS